MKCLLLLSLLSILLFPFSLSAKTSDSLYIQVTYPQPAQPFLAKRLPTIQDKPRIAYNAPKSPQDERYPRVVKILGFGGQCVTVAQNNGFPIHAGAARNWPVAASNLGYEVGSTPKVGSVIVTRESSYGTNSGHVALVKRVEGEYVYVLESNYIGGKKTEGWIPVSKAVAFIYPKN